MILLMIIFVALIQVGIYAVLDTTKYRRLKLKGLVLVMLLFCHFFVFPKMFYPDLGPDPVCAMPVVGVTLAFWIFGGLATFVTHVIYWGVTQAYNSLKSVRER